MLNCNRVVATTLLSLLVHFPNGKLAIAGEIENDEVQVKRFLENRLAQIPGKKSIYFDLTDPSQRLPSCQRIEPFLPSTATPTGRITVGIRCVEGAVWTTYRPATIKIFGPAVIATRAMVSGALFDSSNYRMAEIEIPQSSSSFITDPAELIDKTIATSIKAGQPITRQMLRTKVVVTHGDPVRLAYVGIGFTVSADGKSLGSASEGQRVRVQAENGRILSGIARANRIVEVQ
jgi:flagellar basal body P-ring formation protein FlgA